MANSWSRWALVALVAASPTLSGRGAELRGSRLEVLPDGARTALRAFARSVETGDRAAALALLAPGSRASAAPLLDDCLATPREPRVEVVLLVAGWETAPEGLSLRALLQARVRARRAEADGEGEGTLQPESGIQLLPLALRWRASDGLLAVEAGEPAAVTAAEIAWRLDADRLRVRSVLVLTPEVGRLDWLSLSLPPETDRVRLLDEDLQGRWVRIDDGAEDGGRLILRLPAPLSSPRRLTLEHESGIADDLRAGGDSLYLPHGGAIAPWASGRFHLWDLTLDLPDSLTGVSLGVASELEAPSGRRRLRYATTRPVDYPGIMVGKFRVDRRGPLELWRVAEVGGPADRLLGELETLVAFHESRVAALPYGAFRLVEVDMGFASAVSYASVIVMKTAVMAKAKERFAILSHEVAHQWWGNAVQGDQHTRWISEGMANALMDLFVASVEGGDAKQDLLDSHRRQTLANLGAGALPLANVAGRPADFYQRGALFVHALAESVGGEIFWAILQAWYAEHAGPAVGTPALRATAERVAGRSLAEVFEPWLGTTALPVLDLEWTSEGSMVTVVITQEEPSFALGVPLEALLPDGVSDWTTVRASGPRTETDWALPAAPLALRLDPEEVTPRVREGERLGYWLAEAEACLDRGEIPRGLALLDRAEKEAGTLPESASRRRASALAAAGRLEDSDAAIRADLAELPVDATHAALLERIEVLLADGQAATALGLIDDLAARVTEGAAVPLRRAHALRMLGRDAEARSSYEKALAERPECEAARVALGLPAEPEPEEPNVLLSAEDPRLAGNHPDRVALLAASDERWGLLLPGSRRLLLGRGDDVEAVADYSPPDLADAALLDADAGAALVVTLEAGRRRGALAVIELDERGRGRVVARHERIPAKPQRIASDGISLLVAWSSREDGLDWYRFLPPPRLGTAGPDDRDGLVTLKLAGDPRFELAGHTPLATHVILLGDGSLAWLDGRGVLRSEAGVLWERLDGDEREVIDLRRDGAGAALLVVGDRSRSPFDEDAQVERRLVVIDAERFVDRLLPDDAVQAAPAPDGSVLVLRAASEADGAGLGVGRLRP